MNYKLPIACMVLCVLGAGLAFAADEKKPEHKPATSAKSEKPEKDAKSAPAAAPAFVTEGIKAMSEEMEKVIEDPKNGTRHVKCDYFEKSTEAVDQKVLIDLLGKKQHKDPRVDAYIKWQLLSLRKGMFDADLVDDVLKIYRVAPRPIVRPGADAEPQMAQMVQRLKKEEVTQFTALWDEKVATHYNIYQPMLEYRNELYARLPRDFKVVRAGFQDAEERARLGYEIGAFTKQLGADLRTVAASAKPVEIGAMRNLALNYADKGGTKFFKTVKYDDKKKSASWESSVVKFDKKTFETLASDLEQMAKSGF